MADTKIEVQLTFEDFAKKYKDVIELKQLKAELRRLENESE